MEAQRSSENLVSIYQTACCHVPEGPQRNKKFRFNKKMEVFPRQEKKNTKEGIEGMAKLNLNK